MGRLMEAAGEGNTCRGKELNTIGSTGVSRRILRMTVVVFIDSLKARTGTYGLCFYRLLFMVNTNSLPCPSSLKACNSASCLLAISFAMASPRPVPV